VFEPSILIDPAELRSEASVERLEKANKYLKDMAYKKVRDLRTPESSFREAITRREVRERYMTCRLRLGVVLRNRFRKAIRLQQIGWF